KVQGVPRYPGRRGVEAGEPIVVVVDVETPVFRNDHAAGEEVHAEPRVLPAYFGGVEHTANVVPGKCAHEALLAIAQFLAADFERERKFLVVTKGEVGLVQIDRVGLRAIAPAVDGA